MKQIISTLTKNNLLQQDEGNVLFDSFGKNKELIQRLDKKYNNKKMTRKYSSDLRRFSISLHFFSPRAYSFIREQFNSVLPHARTLSKWYASVNAEPGICKEALNTLKLKCDNTANPVYCALIMDEVAIRKHVEWDGYKYHGYVDFGAQLNNESLEMETECLVFLLVSKTESWKLPVAYFLCDHLSSMQKGNLVEQCLEKIHSTGIKVVSLTFMMAVLLQT